MDAALTLPFFQPRYDYRAIPPQLLRSARTMRHMDWIRSPAHVAHGPTPLLLRPLEHDTKTLHRLASGPTDLMATWKARTFLMRHFERRIDTEIQSDKDVDSLYQAFTNQEATIARWCRTATRLHEFIYLHALLIRNGQNPALDINHEFMQRIFDPLVAMTVTRRTATASLPIYTRRVRGAIARAFREVTRDWTLLHYGLDVDEPTSHRQLLRIVGRGQFAGDEFIAMEFGRRLRMQSRDKNHHDMGWWLHGLPTYAFTP